MRTLLLLRGAPGVGKSTWIKENNLENYVLETDKFRQLLANPVLTEDGTMVIPQKNDVLAAKMLMSTLEERMKNGDFTVIDATHSNENTISKYRKLIKKYRYQVYYKEFNVEWEELMRRNDAREEHKQVPVKEIERIYTLLQHSSIDNFATKIEDVSEIMNYYVADVTDVYDRVKIIGDIQGCYTVLNEAISNELDNRTLYVFAGDMLDRGIENKEILDFMLSIYKRKNVILVEGNHDTTLMQWADDWDTKLSHEFTHRTLRQLLQYKNKEDFAVEVVTSADGTQVYAIDGVVTDIESFGDKPYLRYENHTLWLRPYEGSEMKVDTGISVNMIDEKELKKKVRELTSRLRLAYAFEFHGRKYFVNHAGISALPQMTLIPGIQLVRGVGDYDTHIDDCWEKSYNEGKTQGFIQVHGHRSTPSTEHSICLECGVEFGGNLRVLEIDENGHELHEYRNTVTRDYSEGSEFGNIFPLTSNEVTNRMMIDRHVRVKHMEEEGLYSLNFKDSVFRKKNWTSNTIKARGLFVDDKTGDIAIRSYNKFFNLYEREETQVGTLRETLAFPITAYKKYNGFLGMASVVNGELVLACKSTTSGEYVDYFKEIFGNLTNNEKNQLKKLSEKYHCSFTFEVMHLSDRHIIDFDENKLVILDAIENTYDIGGIDVNRSFSDKVLNQLLIESDFFSKKEVVETFDDIETFMRYVAKQKKNRTLEGLVVEDMNGYMFKVKYDFYSKLKHLRTLCDVVKSRYHTKYSAHIGREPYEIEFIYWCENQSFDKLMNTHIIDLFNEYEKELGHEAF